MQRVNQVNATLVITHQKVQFVRPIWIALDGQLRQAKQWLRNAASLVITH